MTAKPSIHPLAHTHLRELRERWGVEPALEEALWIVECCGRVVNPCADGRLDLIGIPVRCGASGEWLWPVTVGAAVWYQDLAEAWWKGEPEKLGCALAFALAHARDKETLRACRTRQAAEALIREWSLSLTCTREELDAAVDAALPAPPAQPRPLPAQARTDWEALVGEIELVSGIAADHWLWDVSRDATLRAWFRARQVAAAQGGRAAPACPGPGDEAVADLAAAKAAIISAHRQDAHAPGRDGSPSRPPVPEPEAAP